ncbi:MAG: hypothetical protein Q7R94_02890 [bacterium]|nr:hypothetical protein [bacterium]
MRGKWFLGIAGTFLLVVGAFNMFYAGRAFAKGLDWGVVLYVGIAFLFAAAVFLHWLGTGKTVGIDSFKRNHVYVLLGQCSNFAHDGYLVFVKSVDSDTVYALRLNSRISVEDRGHFFVTENKEGKPEFKSLKVASA